MAPNPTSTAKEVAATRLSGIIPWFANPPDATHVKAADVIGRIWLRDTETGDNCTAYVGCRWNTPRRTLSEELSPLRAIFLISGYYTELGKRLVETTWVADGVTDDEMGVLTVVLSYVWKWDSESATLLLESVWVADGITREDRMTAAMIDRISLFQREFGRRLISAPLVADGLNNDERKAVEGALSYIAGRDIELALLLLASSWVADGISPEERYSMEIIDRISAIDGELGKLVVESQWVADGISPEERYSMETIDRISAIDGELGKLVVEFQWVADGLNEDEMKAFTGALSYIAERDIELAMLLLASSWVADGISPEERYTLETIDHISGNDGQIAKELVASQWIADGVDSSETYVLDALLRVSEHPDSYSQLTSQPWFIDGLDDEEAVFVIALGGAASRSLKLFEDLLTAHYIQHRTISLPLAGEVNIWVIQNSPPFAGRRRANTH